MSQAPTVGRIVHYRDHHAEQCTAALVVAVNAGSDVTLRVFPASGADGTVWAGEDQQGVEAGTWHWPERVG